MSSLINYLSNVVIYEKRFLIKSRLSNLLRKYFSIEYKSMEGASESLANSLLDGIKL